MAKRLTSKTVAPHSPDFVLQAHGLQLTSAAYRIMTDEIRKSSLIMNASP
ncbi:hypothetical protein ABIA23_005788 [Sinorhizobium fredii]